MACGSRLTGRFYKNASRSTGFPSDADHWQALARESVAGRTSAKVLTPIASCFTQYYGSKGDGCTSS